MKYKIIQDCSPYFIRFTHQGADIIIKKCLHYVRDINFVKSFTHHRYNVEQSMDILGCVPFNKELTFDKTRVSLFVTQPGHSYVAHKDGMDHRYSINYNVKILDSECVTSWYKNSDLQHYSISNGAFMNTRDCIGFDKTQHTPTMKMTAIQGEVVLFNTELFHDWDNTSSRNERMILTLRDIKPSNIYFEDVRMKLFGTYQSFKELYN